jgi:hypothetical protein
MSVDLCFLVHVEDAVEDNEFENPKDRGTHEVGRVNDAGIK